MMAASNFGFAQPPPTSLARNTKFIDLPSNVKDGLLTLERTIRETSHKATSPAYRYMNVDKPKSFLTEEIERIKYKLLQYSSVFTRSKKLYEIIKEREDVHAVHTELGIRILERFKNVQLRNGLYSMDHPISTYFNQLLTEYENQFELLKKKLIELEDYFTFFERLYQIDGIREPSSKWMDEILKNIYHSIIKISGRLENIEKGWQEKKEDNL